MNGAVRTAGALAALAVLLFRTAPPRPLPAPPSAGALLKLSELRAILRSKNDNDPRLDSDFDGLTEEEKALFRREYAALPPELRNERGTIVYLLGRGPATPEDWDFLRAVAGEPPCLSLADCSRRPAPGLDEDPGDAVTLAYPALVAMSQAARVLEASAPGTPETAAARAVIGAGRDSKAPAAVRLMRRFARERR
jgi:hypothetical protein